MNWEQREIRKNRYLEALYRFGLITLCYLIDEYEKQEDYEECQLILESLQYVNAVLKTDFPTKYDQDAQDYFLKSFLKIAQKEGSLENIKFYASETKRMVDL